jgi:cyclase
MAPENVAKVTDIWAESDATQLPGMVGVKWRRLFQFHGLYFHLIESEGDADAKIEAARTHPLFRDVNEKLKPYIEAYDPKTWRAPGDAMAKEFYSWNASV